jgi:transcriptional regulator with XRE-family HTH domain
MHERTMKPGRPKGATTIDPVVAQAFGSAVREARLQVGMAQEEVAHRAGIERSHMGKIERGEHIPTLALALKVARALGISAAALVARMEETLPASYKPTALPANQTRFTVAR